MSEMIVIGMYHPNTMNKKLIRIEGLVVLALGTYLYFPNGYNSFDRPSIDKKTASPQEVLPIADRFIFI